MGDTEGPGRCRRGCAPGCGGRDDGAAKRHLRGGMGVSDNEKEKGDGESTGCGSIAPPPDAQSFQYFGPMERAAERSGYREAAVYLQKAKLARIKTHASKAVRHSDIR